MKKLIFWASVLLLAGAVASCEPQTPQEPENPAQPETPIQPEDPTQPENPENSDTPSKPGESTLTNFTETVKGISFDMIAVEGGTFLMGAEGDLDAYGNSSPIHSVTLSSYYLSKTEVTQALYKAIMGVNPTFQKGDNLPVAVESWEEAKIFCEKLSQQTGKKYVLPTEAQWEYAARGGKYKENTIFAGSNVEDEVSWNASNANNQIQPVGTKAPNALGLYDMSGNVDEWCFDVFADYPAEPQTDPEGPKEGETHVVRGGGIGYSGWSITMRLPAGGTGGYGGDFGFRIAMIP